MGRSPEEAQTVATKTGNQKYSGVRVDSRTDAENPVQLHFITIIALDGFRYCLL